MKRFILLCLLASVQAGPYKWKQRPVAKPLVVAAQWYVHQKYLAVEQELLRVSVDVGKLAEITTKEAYTLTYQAEEDLRALRESLSRESKSLKMLSWSCVNNAANKHTLEYFDRVKEKMYACTHTISDTAATFEVEMTQRLIEARGHVWNIEQAMWFCQKFTDEEDVECLKRLVLEGLQLADKMPDRAAWVLDRAQAESGQALDKLRNCVTLSVSAAQDRLLVETQRMRRCVMEAQESDDDGEREKPAGTLVGKRDSG
ncbi:uncharacterized protein LOC124366974 [Homalodisca vitripennis]|uniref:uncharacterized protein LOC124366974 n=1 Tax=Homalodisca vitripennis TaxID=197043 RepID=UPI001EEB859E|nr:uncharacterized protein LOC124366974 [Homalodisca vitripennis]